MSKALTKLNLQQRKVLNFGRVTNENKESFRRLLNNYGRGTGLNWIPKSANVRELQQAKKAFLERNAYNILGLTVDEGNTILAHEYSRDFKKANDKDVQHMAQYAEKFAKAKHEMDKKLTVKEKNFLNMSNQGVLGYGDLDIVTIIESGKYKKKLDELAVDLLEYDPLEDMKDKNFVTVDRVFQRVGIRREDDLDKVKEKLSNLDVYEFNNAMNYLLESLEIFDSDKQGMRSSEELLLNARLDDFMIKTGVKKGRSKLKKVFMENKKRG